MHFSHQLLTKLNPTAKPHHAAAQSILTLFRGRAKAEDVIAHLDTLRNTLESEISELELSAASADPSSLGLGLGRGFGTNVNSLVRIITTQSLLHIGSRSFSHLLNAIERYLPLLRTIASGTFGVGVASGSSGGAGAGTGLAGGVGASAGGVSGGAIITGPGNPEAKSDILTAAAAFWKYNSQMVAIVFDKLMQYQIVDPTDVVEWTFLHVSEGLGGDDSPLSKGIGDDALKAPLSLSTFEWDLLKGALNKAIGRVNIARRKLAMLRKEDDDNRARAKAKASGEENMDVDGDVKPGKLNGSGASQKTLLNHSVEEPVTENPALIVALKAFSSLTREQKAALSRTLEGFVSCLAPSPTSTHPNPKAREILSENSWHNRANWGKEEWNAWETWGWYRHFCRVVSVCWLFGTGIWRCLLTDS